MSHELIRTHVVMPKDLLEEADKLVGSRHRSEFVTAAAAEKVARMKLRQAAHKLGGSLEHTDIPGRSSSPRSVTGQFVLLRLCGQARIAIPSRVLRRRSPSQMP
ncbi:hypothetical protein NITHO_1800003 [Nitrolancea hollandica Lb]|uniref:Uncharacterized protein n=1 Tax=Nitrolancea hollandica Lb TaxID=1129897 RepID=I4EEE5_9BACT|nr:hypothetical protein NITHO_1800003 [Nitrolancea hollandica Lb]